MKHLLPIALTVLLLACCTTPGEYRAMRHGLDSINGLNRSDRPFSPADVQPYVSYFDRHGSGNDRLLAHYLLGRAYHEQGEAPMALQCYQEALAAADTTAADCDYSQLSRVYGQMGDIFYDQNLFRLQLHSHQLASYYAYRGKDTLAALVNYEQQGAAYMALDILDSAIVIAENAASHYAKYGYPSYAAVVLGSIIRPCTSTGNYEKARRYIDIYEKEAGVIDKSGNIEKGREVYYFAKGMYFMQTHRYDSAEYWFRKELLYGKDYSNQNGGAYGLAKVFEYRHQSDSAAKYYSYAYAMNDSAYMEMTSAEIAKMQSMYNYTRYQETAWQASRKIERLTLWLAFIVSFVLIISFAVYIFISKIRQKRIDLERKYLDTLVQIEQAQSDIAFLRGQQSDNEGIISQQSGVIANISMMIEEKDSVIEKLKEEISEILKKRHKQTESKREADILNSVEYKAFYRNVEKYTVPSENEWRKLRTKVFECLPEFHQLLLANRQNLNISEYNECILVRLHFKPSDIVNLLQISPSYVNKIRKTLLKKLFDKEGKAEVFDTLIQDFS